jgi:hypothetical protein
MMDKNILEFWGQAFLNAARSQQQLEYINKLIGSNAGTDNPFWQSFFKAFDWRKPEKTDTTDAGDLSLIMSDVYQEFVKSYLALFSYIPREEYLQLAKENEELKTKIAELENSIIGFNNSSVKNDFDQEQVVDNLTKIMKNQAQHFQDLMKQLNQHYKKAATAKKK